MKMNLFPSFTNTDQVAEYVRDNFRWAPREPSAPSPRPLPPNYCGLRPLDLEVATRYAQDSHIPEMVQATFYAMVVDDAAELGFFRRLTMDCVIWAMQKLDWGQLSLGLWTLIAGSGGPRLLSVPTR